MKVVLFGGEFANKGAEAMALTTQRELRRRVPDSSFAIMRGVYDVPAQTQAHGKRVGIQMRPLPKQNQFQQASLLFQQILRRPARWLTWLNYRFSVYQAYGILEDADAVIDISGFAYADKFGTSNAATMNALVGHAARQGKPYVFMPQCWGPFGDHTELRSLCAEALPQASRYYTRDEQSQRHIADLLECPRREVPLAPDVAFLFEPASQRDAFEQMRAQGLAPSKRPIVGVAPNMRVYDRMEGEGAANTYLRTLVQLCVRCVEEWDADVALIPHEIKIAEQNPSDDRMLCNIIEASVREHIANSALSDSAASPINPSSNSGASVAALTEEAEARRVKALIGACDLLVGSRFHSLVAALSQGVPPVAVGWAHKYPQLLGDFGLEQFAMRYQELGDGALVELFSKAWKERKTSQSTIESHLPNIRKQAEEVFEETAGLLRANLADDSHET